ncbi:hypothetical protein BDV23DRAFT_159540 [Aspergillus alliaceus]|uniref:Uncharacterized protein n=1 Tax=Petromyces alliaceus TaxID=209559 RepID=A0A5N7C2F1_PETAA|nr:hypothetical protein BDV23DRAFT_159540 [Aspergillus alliaceus]
MHLAVYITHDAMTSPVQLSVSDFFFCCVSVLIVGTSLLGPYPLSKSVYRRSPFFFPFYSILFSNCGFNLTFFPFSLYIFAYTYLYLLSYIGCRYPFFGIIEHHLTTFNYFYN